MNQQEQISQGSLRSSHRNTHAVIFKKSNPKDQKKVLDFLTSACKDLIISQRVGEHTSYVETPLKNYTFFLHNTSSKAEPGFLVLIPNMHPVFVKYNLSKKERERNNNQPICYTLRMRISKELYDGTVFVATLDGINHSMMLEDIYVWKNDYIFESKTFTERRVYMKEFVERHWIPDVRLLGGIVTEIMNPQPLEFLESLKDTKDFTKVFLIPDSPAKRRFTFNLNDSIAQIQNGYYSRQNAGQKPSMAEKKPVQEKKQVLQKQAAKFDLTVAKAVKIPLLPDIYELFDVSGNSLNKAAVQQLSLSKQLKEAGDEMMVNIKYNHNFNRYEIIGLNTP